MPNIKAFQYNMLLSNYEKIYIQKQHSNMEIIFWEEDNKQFVQPLIIKNASKRVNTTDCHKFEIDEKGEYHMKVVNKKNKF
jgi:hypothetical protein